MKILIASSEAMPYIKSGGLADVIGSLSIEFAKMDHDCRVVLPLYDDIKEEYKDKMKLIASINIPLAWRNQYCGILEMKAENGVIFYFLDNEYYFKRRGLYGFYDEAERFAFFSKAVLEILPYIDFYPDVIHCNDWQTALVPVFLNMFYKNVEFYEDIKTIFTIHNIQYQGEYDIIVAEDILGIPKDKKHILEYHGDVNFMKGAIEECDYITTVSPSYANEILDPWYSHGLDHLLREKKYKLKGILNGIDYNEYSSKIDKDIIKKFDGRNFTTGKRANKEDLQKTLALDISKDAMVVSIVSRLVNHKGLDLIRQVFPKMMEYNIQFLVLGSGEWEYENFFREAQAIYPNRTYAYIGFNEDLARKIYAGSDLFLMPSKSEPCGLSQMISLSYGTLPLVRITGGLADTVDDLGDGSGNGYTFLTYYAADMMTTFERAYNDFQDKVKWRNYVRQGMKSDFSWDKSAAEYIDVFEEIISQNL